MIGTPMTSGSKFGRSRYHLTDMQVGETREFKVPNKVRDRIRRAAHNHNARTDMYFSTRCVDGVIYVTRIR
jgi:hypothetical protein